MHAKSLTKPEHVAEQFVPNIISDRRSFLGSFRFPVRLLRNQILCLESKNEVAPIAEAYRSVAFHAKQEKVS